MIRDNYSDFEEEPIEDEVIESNQNVKGNFWDKQAPKQPPRQAAPPQQKQGSLP